MNKKYVAKTKMERISDAEKWINTLEANPAYKAAVDIAKDKVQHLSLVNDTSDVTCEYGHTEVAVYNNDVALCTKAAINHADEGDKICVLDFASYTNPGGGFLSGALSQEESICRMSGLYPLLNEMSSVYESRRKDKKLRAVYGNDIIYCQDVPFMINSVGRVYLADVLVSAAPNKKAAIDNTYTSEEVDAILLARMEKVFLTPYQKGCSTVLLGAYGCGVFGNDVELVARHWNYLVREVYRGLYKKVIHPVFDKKQSDVFRRICIN